MFQCPLDCFCTGHLLSDVVDDGQLGLVMLGGCIGSGDKHMVAKVFVCPFWWCKHCVLVVLLGRVVPGCSLASGVMIWVPVGVLVGPGCVVP